MTRTITLSAACAALALVAFASGPAFARGGAPNIMDSPGYQRRLQESRQQLQQPYTTPPAVYPRQRVDTPRKAKRKPRR
jgi:predicted PurR-regulated permease PerM